MKEKIKCTLMNTNTYNELEYWFDVIPRKGEQINISGMILRYWEAAKGFVELDETTPYNGIYTFRVVEVVHDLLPDNVTSITVIISQDM